MDNDKFARCVESIQKMERERRDTVVDRIVSTVSNEAEEEESDNLTYSEIIRNVIRELQILIAEEKD